MVAAINAVGVPAIMRVRWNDIGHPLVHYWVLEYELA